MNKKFKVGFSFAGEDRGFVEKVVQYLKNRGIDVFYDADYDIDMWGKNITNYLDDVYRDKCCFVVVFISKFYINKSWTNFEFDIIKDRWLMDRNFILPVKLDETNWKGLSNSIGYVNASSMSADELGSKILKKINKDNVSDDLIYSEDALSDIDFSINSDSEVGDILKGLKSYNFYIQNDAINKICDINWGLINGDECFVLGRNILQSAEGDVNGAADFLLNIRKRLSSLPEKVAWDILSGVVYEIYFDNTSKFRNVIKGKFLKEVVEVLKVKKYNKSYKFILGKLNSKRKCFSTAPLFGETVIEITVVLKRLGELSVDKNVFNLEDLIFDNNSLLKLIPCKNNLYNGVVDFIDDLKNDIYCETGVSKSLIHFENIDCLCDRSREIKIMKN